MLKIARAIDYKFEQFLKSVVLDGPMLNYANKKGGHSLKQISDVKVILRSIKIKITNQETRLVDSTKLSNDFQVETTKILYQGRSYEVCELI